MPRITAEGIFEDGTEPVTGLHYTVTGVPAELSEKQQLAKHQLERLRVGSRIFCTSPGGFAPGFQIGTSTVGTGYFEGYSVTPDES